MLTVQMFMIYVFATQYARRNSFRAFWFTHNSYPIFYMLMVLHGAGRLVQPALFHLFFLGPAILFAIDRLISVSRKKVEIPVVKAELLPSGKQNDNYLTRIVSRALAIFAIPRRLFFGSFLRLTETAY